MEINNHLRKFKVFLEKIIQDKYELSSYYSDKILKYLEDRSNTSPSKVLLETPAFSDLIFYSLEKIHNSSTSVRIFIIKIVNILFGNELQFSKLQMQGFKLCTLKRCVLDNFQSRIPSAALQEACFNVANSQLSHISGLKLIVEMKLWEKILYPEVYRSPKRVANASFDFITKLVWTLNDYEDEKTINEIFNFIIQPINDCAYRNIEVLDMDNDNKISETILTSLQALISILGKIDRILAPNRLIKIFRLSLIMKDPIHQVLHCTRNEEVIILISNIYLIYDIALSKDALLQNERRYNDFYNQILSKYVNIVGRIIKKRMAYSVLEFVVQTNILWSKIKLKFETFIFEINGQKYDIQNQFMMLILVPLVVYVVERCRSRNESVAKVEDYHIKLGKLMTEHIFKSSYLFRTIIKESDLQKTAIQAVKELFKLQGHLNGVQAGILFQCLYYVLELFVVTDGNGGLILNGSFNPLEYPDDVKLLALVLDAIKMLLMEHNIHWHENVEIISLQTGLTNLLKQNILPNKQLLQVLDLIGISIKKFLSPDMTLLVESKQGSALNEIGGVMKTFIQHEDWEVRDSALSLLLICTDISFVKYEPLQKLICGNGLCTLALQAALGDPEFYAQITALKCLAAATKIECIWREVIASDINIYKHLFGVIRSHPEGMVRKEAVNVLTQVYTTQRISDNFSKCIYIVMSGAALDDLHWEVQLAALNFWKHSLQRHLVDRGMIDGRFPSVTFSKEKRKILVLNDKEIERQLIGIMNDLSSISCLTVLNECMKEDYNIEVMEQAYALAKDLIKILDYYRFEKVPNEPPIVLSHVDVKEEMNTEDIVLDLSLSYTATAQEKVIGSILSTKQGDLIMNMHDNYIETECNRMIEDVQVVPTSREKLHPNRFLQIFKGTDYSSVFNAKKTRYIEEVALDNLLDEVMSFKENEGIIPSCYD